MAKQKELKQVKLTDEIRQKLYGYSITSGSINITYKPTIDGVPEDFTPKFNLKTLTVSEVEVLKTKVLDETTEDFYNDIIRTHIIGWTNLIDVSTGDVVAFVGEDCCDKELYDKLPNMVKLDILQHLMKMSIK